MSLFNNNNGGCLCKKHYDSGKTFFDTSVNNGQSCNGFEAEYSIGFEADKPEKLQKHSHLISLSDKDLV